MKAATFTVCLLVLTAGCIVQTDGSGPETDTPSTPDRIDEKAITPEQPKTPSAPEYSVEVGWVEDLVHQQVNKKRVAHGVGPLNRSKKLDSIAKYKSWDMAQKDYFMHRGSNGTTHKMLRENYQSRCNSIGQNILKHPEGANLMLDSRQSALKWAEKTANSLMNSTGHRQNILDPNYEVQGIGIFVDENGTVFLTQEFCG